MADNEKLVGNLRVGLEQLKKDVEQANKILESLNKEKLKINLDLDISTLKNLKQVTTQLETVKKELSQSIKLNIGTQTINSELDKFVKVTETVSGSSEKTSKEIRSLTDELGRQIKIIDIYDKETEQVEKVIKEVTTDYKKQREEVEKLANKLGELNEKTQIRKNSEYLKEEQKRASVINKNIEQEYRRKEVKEREINDLARKLIYKEEQQRLKTVTETQKKIEKNILGSNETIAEQQKRISKRNAQEYEQLWLKAIKKKEREENRVIEKAQKEYQKLLKETTPQGKFFGTSTLGSGDARAGMANKLANSAIYTTGYYLWSSIANGAREAVTTLSDYEQGIIGLARTMDNVTKTQLTEFGVQAVKMAKEFGVSIQEVQNAMYELSKAGIQDQKQLLEGTRTVLTALNTGDIQSSTEIVRYLVSTVKQLNLTMEDSMKIIDAWNKLSDTYSTKMSDYSEALSRAGANAKALGLDINEINAVTTVMVERLGASGEQIGTSIKSLTNRILRKETVKTLEDLGVQVMKDAEHFKSFQEIMTQVNEKINEFGENSILTQRLLDAIGGSWRINQIRVLAENWNEIDKIAKESAESIGYSVEENTKVMNTYEKQVKQLWATIQEFFLVLGEAGLLDLLKNLTKGLQFGINTLNQMDKGMSKFIINALAIAGAIKTMEAGAKSFMGLNFVEMVLHLQANFLKAKIATEGMATAQKLLDAAFKAQMITEQELITIQAALTAGQKVHNLSTQAATVQQQVFSAAIKGTAASAVGLQIALGAATLGISLAMAAVLSYSAKQKQLKEQLESTKKAQVSFNKALEEFQQTLNPDKINEMANALENLKQNLEYEDKVAELQRLEEELEKLQSSNFLSYSFNADTREIEIERLKIKIKKLREEIGKVDEQQRKLNEAEELANALDYEKYQNTVRDIAAKVRQINTEKELVKQYEESLKKGKEDINIKNQLAEKYPQYITLLDKTNNTTKINTELLNENLDSQKELALVEIVSAQSAMRSSYEKTQQILKDTKTRIEAIEAEQTIYEKYQKDAKEKLEQARRSGNEEAFHRAAISLGWTNSRMISSTEEISNAKQRLLQLERTLEIQENFINSDPEELLEKYSSVKTTGISLNTAKTSSKTSSKKSTEIYQAQINQFQKLEDAIALVNLQLERNNILTDISPEKDKINLLSERIELLKQEQQILHSLAEAKRTVISQNVSKLSNMGFDVSYDPATNNLVIHNMERLNQIKGKDVETTNKLRKKYEELIKETLSLNDANRQAGTQYMQLDKEIKTTTETIENLKKKQREAAQTIEQEIIQALKDRDSKEKEIEQNRLNRKKEILQEELNEELEIIEKKKEAYEEDYEAYKESIEQKYQAQIDALKREKDLLRQQYEEDKFQEEQQERREKLTKLESRYNKAGLSDLQRYELSKEISELQKEIRDAEKEHELSSIEEEIEQKISLVEEERDNLLDIAEQERDDYLKILEEKKEKTKKNYDQLIDQVENDLKNIEKSHVDYAEEAFNIMKMSQEEILNFLLENSSKWAEMGKLQGEAYVNELKQQLDLAEKHREYTVGKGSAVAGSQEEKENLERIATNKDYVKSEIERAKTVIQYRESQGLDTSDQREYLDYLEKNKYHDGGFVGGKALDPKHEEVAKFLKGELAVTPTQLDKAWYNIGNFMKQTYVTAKQNLKTPSLSVSLNMGGVKVSNDYDTDKMIDRAVQQVKTEIMNIVKKFK